MFGSTAAEVVHMRLLLCLLVLVAGGGLLVGIDAHARSRASEQAANQNAVRVRQLEAQLTGAMDASRRQRDARVERLLQVFMDGLRAFLTARDLEQRKDHHRISYIQYEAENAVRWIEYFADHDELAAGLWKDIASRRGERARLALREVFHLEPEVISAWKAFYARLDAWKTLQTQSGDASK